MPVSRYALFAALLAGCSYPQYDFVPTEPGVDTGEPEDTSVVVVEDTSIDATDAKPDAKLDASETAVDSSVTDTSVVVDSGPKDTGVVDTGPKDTGPTVGCASITATFCADFDSVSSVSSTWSGADTVASGTVAFDTTARSSPKSFLATVPASSFASAFLWKDFVAATTTTAMRADAWIMLDSATAPSTTGSHFLLKLERTSGSTGDGVTVSIDNAGLYADRIGTSYEAFRLSYTVKPGTWMHVRMDAVIHTTSGALTVWIDDMTTPLLVKTGISTAQSDTTGRTLVAGLLAQNTNAAFRARFDDVSFSWK